jgi:hypothetical protein
MIMKRLKPLCWCRRRAAAAGSFSRSKLQTDTKTQKIQPKSSTKSRASLLAFVCTRPGVQFCDACIIQSSLP